ncbi:YfhO family protein [Haliscomenobacter sp.]|uniref:YfhO family protein n=1 Tax=Haliscomenobacter sp. TaxID=2717303 RepID=UPI003593A63E
MNHLIKQLIPHLIAVAILVGVSAFYFAPQLSGKVMSQSDIVQVTAMMKEMNDYNAKEGRMPLWTNNMFGGMPTYQIASVRAGNQTGLFDNLMQLYIPRPIGRFISAMLAFYILMVVLGVNRWVGVIGAISFGLATNNLVLFEAGHTSKLGAIAYMPLLAAGLLLAFRDKKYLAGALLFGIGSALQLWVNHVQMTYYLILTMLAFGIAQLVDSIRKGEIVHFAKAAIFIIVSGLIGVGTGASNLLTTLEYKESTMRGKKIQIPAPGTAEAKNPAPKEGLGFEYATQWSNTGIDLLSTLIPRAAGGSNAEPIGADSKTMTSLVARGYQGPTDIELPMYWGGLPFTSGPGYLGAVALFLFVFGLFTVKGPVKWWLGFGVIFTMILSLGKNDGGLNKFLFDNLPLFNSFRAPSSVLSVTAFLVPMLGFLALGQVFKTDEDPKKLLTKLWISAGLTGGLSLFFALLGGSFFSFSGANDAQLASSGLVAADIVADRKALFSGDAWRSFFLIALCAGLIWALVTKKISSTIAIAGIGLLTIFDVWGVGRRYVSPKSFVTKTDYQNNFQARPVDLEIINKEKDLYYRVHEVKPDAFQWAMTSYFHKTIGGYNPAKMQRYNDVIERFLAQGDKKVLDMLNTKYYIFTPEGQQQPMSQINPGALGNAWFVDTLLIAESDNIELAALSAFSPDSQAIVHQEFNAYIKNFDPKAEGSIKLTSYHPEKLKYQSDSPSEQFAVFSEIWYGPNKGWNAYIDGKPAEHIRVNYLLRGMRIPAGKHEVEFRFEPASFAKGKAISTASSLTLIVGVLGIVGTGLWKFLKNPPAEEPKPQPKPQQPKPSAPAAPRTTASDRRDPKKRKR